MEEYIMRRSVELASTHFVDTGKQAQKGRNMFEERIALVDADSIYFRVCCVTKKKNEIRRGIKNYVNSIKENCMTDRLLIAVKGRGNFRHDIYPPYKSNRKELDEDLKEALNYGHTFMVEEIGATTADGMEADDLVSIWANEAAGADTPYVVVGIDKDLLQITGDHYNFVKLVSQTIDYDTGNLHLMRQCLTGDSTDNIPGIKGIGPKKADNILHGVPVGRRWDRVRAAWRKHKAGDPTTPRRLLSMLTSWKEYDDIRSQIENKATLREQDAGKQRQETVQEPRVHEVSNRHSERSSRN